MLEETVDAKAARVAQLRESIEEDTTPFELVGSAVAEKDGALTIAQVGVQVWEIVSVKEELRANHDAMKVSMHTATQKVSDGFSLSHDTVRKAWTVVALRLSAPLGEISGVVEDEPEDKDAFVVLERAKKRPTLLRSLKHYDPKEHQHKSCWWTFGSDTVQKEA